jgi:signal transduction histidine kinase
MTRQVQSVAPKVVTDELESCREFISMAAHDLREPLRGIRLGAQLLGVGRESADEDAARGTRYIVDGVERLEKLIRDIAEYCYEEAREHDSRETDMDMVLLEAKSELARELKDAGAALTHDPLPPVLGNATALGAVLRNLIGNACKFRSDRALSIHVGAKQEGRECIFTVSDNGRGFDPAYRERIFRAFERLNGKQFPGSGLGLTVAKRVIEHHGGQIWADSNPGAGSVFSFRLPLAV